MIIVPIDIETIPDQREGVYERYLDEVEPPGNYKKQESIDRWLIDNAERVALENWHKTALNGLHGEICSISYAVEDRDIQTITRGYNENDDEATLLSMFWFSLIKELEKFLDGRSPSRDCIKWVGHNVIDFDLRFIKQRSIVTGVRPWFDFNEREAFDTMKEWAGWRGTVSQDNLCKALDITPPEEYKDVADTDGSQVFKLYQDGEYEKIAKYNALDVWKVREIYWRMQYVNPVY